MSASLVFKPNKPEESNSTGITACQVRNDLNKLFGEYPITLDETSIKTLEILQTLHDDNNYNNPWKDLIKLVKTFDNGIILWEEY